LDAEGFRPEEILFGWYSGRSTDNIVED
jgi:hypothetical protein